MIKQSRVPFRPISQLLPRRLRKSQALVTFCLLGPLLLFAQTLKADSGQLVKYAMAGDLVQIKKMVEDGTDVNARTGKGLTALMLASLRGHSETVIYLLDKKALVDIKDDSGMTSLMAASKQGHLDIVKKLVKSGAQVDLPSDKGYTALSLAAMDGRLEVAKFLVSAGADPRLKSADGLSAYDLALLKNQKDVADFLKSKADR